jgi:Zn-dependent metalloprotease
MANNGLTPFSFHVDADPGGAPADLQGPMGVAAAVGGLGAVDTETAARAYLDQGLASAALPRFEISTGIERDVDFRVIGTETVPLTKTRNVKFRQHLAKIPVYGSLVTVEMDQQNGLVSINSALGTPSGVDPVAGISPAAAAEAIRRDAGLEKLPAESMPRLFYYFDRHTQKWLLAYLAENIPVPPRDAAASALDPAADTHEKPPHGAVPLPELFDYVVEAHSGDIVAKLPRVAGAEVRTTVEIDETGRQRQIRAIGLDEGRLRLEDPELNVHTYDAGFKDVRPDGSLPGGYCVNPPKWHRAAVSAHANGAHVAQFVRTVLIRDGVDNRGEGYKATVNCLWGPAANKEWRNAAWYRNQMIYGQRYVSGDQWVSCAFALDVVAHEIFHGVTERTARLEYEGETGALNESYSDIFGIIVSNYPEENLDKWNWKIGERWDGSENPLRDFSGPPRRNQPDHMNNYVVVNLPFNQYNDYGGVHTNSGIHNKAAYNILTAKDAGSYLFVPVEVAQIFYLALSQNLSRSSTFADSRRAVISAARSLLRTDPKRDAKIVAIGAAFDAVGVLDVVV